jgi:hypothetical protein
MSDGLWPGNPRDHRSRGFPGQKPSRVCFCFPQKSHKRGFIFILCHKNYQKTTFNSGIPHAKFAMTLRRWSHDITLICPNNMYDVIEDLRRHWFNRANPYYTYVVSDILIPSLDTTARSPDSTGKILLVFYQIYRIGDSARCWINFARKGILVCVF